MTLFHHHLESVLEQQVNSKASKFQFDRDTRGGGVAKALCEKSKENVPISK